MRRGFAAALFFIFWGWGWLFYPLHGRGMSQRDRVWVTAFLLSPLTGEMSRRSRDRGVSKPLSPRRLGDFPYRGSEEYPLHPEGVGFTLSMGEG